MTIDGPLWFAAALVVCGVHALFLIDWRREARSRIESYREYDAASERRHKDFMAALRDARDESSLDSMP